MRFGATFPTTEIGDDPIAVRDFAQAAESLGYSHIVAYDHVLGAVHAGREPKLWGPYTENDPFHEPFVLFGYLAACTTTIEFETAIIILPQRQTVLAAKQAAEVDILSGGRLRLGVGTGWNPVEYEGLDVPWEGRGRRFDDQIAKRDCRIDRLVGAAAIDHDHLVGASLLCGLDGGCNPARLIQGRNDDRHLAMVRFFSIDDGFPARQVLRAVEIVQGIEKGRLHARPPEHALGLGEDLVRSPCDPVK